MYMIFQRFLEPSLFSEFFLIEVLFIIVKLGLILVHFLGLNVPSEVQGQCQSLESFALIWQETCTRAWQYTIPSQYYIMVNHIDVNIIKVREFLQLNIGQAYTDTYCLLKGHVKQNCFLKFIWWEYQDEFWILRDDYNILFWCCELIM